MKNFIVSALLLMGLSAGAQNTVHHQSLYWIYYQNQLNFSPKLNWNNNIDNRRFFNPDVENQLIFHSRLHYRTGKWDFAGGLTLSFIYSQIPENKSTHVASEIRPVVEVSHEQPLGEMRLQNRLRLDNRFLETSTQQSVLDTSIYVLRFRYRFQVRMPIVKSKDDETILQLRLADEIMLNHKENIFDQNRIYATIDCNLNKNFTLELGYIYIYQQRFAREEFYSRNVIRLGLQHKVFLK